MQGTVVTNFEVNLVLVYYCVLLGVSVPAVAKVVWCSHKLASWSKEIISGVAVIISTKTTHLLLVAAQI